MRIHAEPHSSRHEAWGTELRAVAPVAAKVHAAVHRRFEPLPRPLTLPPLTQRNVRVGFPADPVAAVDPRVDPESGVLLPYALQPLPNEAAEVPAWPTVEEGLLVPQAIENHAKSLLGADRVDSLIRESQALASNGYRQVAQLFGRNDGEWLGRLKTLFRRELTQSCSRALNSLSTDQTLRPPKEFVADAKLYMTATRDLLVAEWKMAKGRQMLDQLRRQEAEARLAETRLSRGAATALRVGVGIAAAAMLLIAPQFGIECLALGQALSESSDSSASGLGEIAPDLSELLDSLGSSAEEARRAGSLLARLADRFL